MSASHKDLDLSFSQNLILLRIKYFNIKIQTVRDAPKYNFLRKYSLVDRHVKNPSILVLTNKAQMYLRFKRKDKFRFWIPVTISTVALLRSYDIYTNSLLEQLLQTAASQLKTIMETLGTFF